jgi:hypothetical protein
VIGDRPSDTPSLGDKTAEFRSIVTAVWGESNNDHTYGKGRAISGQNLEVALKALHIPQDFAYTRPQADSNLLFVHRAVSDGDIYFVDNRNGRAEVLDASFRVTGKSAELWHADTGKIEPASYRIESGYTTVPLKLAPYETVFVVFREPAKNASRSLPEFVETPLGPVDESWQIAFQTGRGAPVHSNFDKLRSWSDSQDAGIKYFSGHGTYTKTLEVPGSWFKPGSELWLDLGDVKNIADVKVNEVPLGILWKPPFRVNVTSALRPGSNRLEVIVTNLWVNRLIGDQQPQLQEKYTFTTHNPYKANSPLLPSGLLGPVQVFRSEVQR